MKIKQKSLLSLAVISALTMLNANANDTRDNVNLNEVTVTSAAGYEQKLTDAPASISVISQEDLQQKPYANLAEAIEHIEGVDVRDGNGKTGGLNISIRGMGSDNTLVLIDGKRQNSAGSSTPNGFGETSNNFLPPLSAIERIEVIKGPMGTLYGSDAMGGVINIITKKVANEWSGSVNVGQVLHGDSQFGDSNTLSTYLSGPIIKDLLGLSLRGSYYKREASDISYSNGEEVSKKGDSPVEGTNYTIGAKLNLTPFDNHDFYLDVFSSKQKYNNDESQIGTFSTEGGYEDELRFEREQITLGHTSIFDAGTLESSIMQNVTEKLGRIIPGDSAKIGQPLNAKMPNQIIGSHREVKTTDIVLDTKFVTPLIDRNIITIGGQYWDSKLNEGLVDEELGQKMWAIFVEDEIAITDSLALTLGGRYDKHDQFGGNFSPRAYSVYTVNDNWTVKGGVSRGYKAPSINDLHEGINSVSGQGTKFNIGTPELKPEKSTNTEVGVYYNADSGFAANATIFHNKYTDKIETQGNKTVSNDPIIPDGTYSQKANIGKAEMQGLEFGTIIPINDALNLKANYTYMDSEQKSGDNIGAAFVNTPEHSINATLNWETTSKLTTWIKAEYRSERKRFTENYSNLDAEDKAIYDAVGDENAYSLFHIGGSYRVNDALTFNGTIYNIFDKDFYDGMTEYTWNDNGTMTTKVVNTEANLEGRRLWLSMNVTF